jgi:hypothetical protein
MLTATVDDSDVIAHIERLVPSMHDALVAYLGNIAREIETDAQARARGHIRFLGAKNQGSYVSSITSGVSDREDRVTGYVRSGHPLAHLLEFGFTISDMTIYASAADVMAFDGGAGTVFAKHVHRHATKVQPYPAIHPAFEDHKAEILDALERVVGGAWVGAV